MINTFKDTIIDNTNYIVKNTCSNIDCANDVLKTLLYFDIFKYPLNINEIIYFSRFSMKDVDITLQHLVSEKIIFKIEEFYSINNDKNLIERRLKGNIRAEKIIKKATEVSKFISQFPYVEGVFISGSLSKGYFEHNDDIDYFIVTSPNRLWIARTILILYKKIFLLNSKKYFCVNYFMSSDSLKIPEKNRFTATEFVTLIPMFGNGIYKKIQQKNSWVLDYFPNCNVKKIPKEINKNIFKRSLEFLLNKKAGDFLEKKFMKATKKHQQKKFKKLQDENFKIAFKGDKNTSKHHPNNHQIKTIEKLNQKIKLFNIKFNYNIPLEK